jgi:hypothetical protein
MQPTNYTPNWQDSRNQKRLQSVLSWCEFSLSEKPRQFSVNELEKVFGQGQNKLACYLRANLLIQCGMYKVGEKFFEYILNKNGFEKLKRNLDVKFKPMIPIQAIEPFKDQLETFTFVYSDKSNRYWHPLQNMKREKKQEFWTKHGLPFDYDIEASAPTILFQLAKKHGLNDLIGQPIQDYLLHKNELRAHVSSVGQCSKEVAKRIITAIFNGAHLSSSPFQHTLDGISSDGKLALKNDPKVRLLHLAVKFMWKQIEKCEGRKKTSSQKWGLYFTYERKILDVIKLHLDKQDVKYFTEHDGWRCDTKLDLPKIEDEVERQTGVRIKIEDKQATQNTHYSYCSLHLSSQERKDTKLAQHICSLHLSRLKKAFMFYTSLETEKYHHHEPAYQ